jgi:hypothetical protein
VKWETHKSFGQRRRIQSSKSSREVLETENKHLLVDRTQHLCAVAVVAAAATSTAIRFTKQACDTHTGGCEEKVETFAMIYM